MERFVKIESWDYMDRKPSIEVRTFKGDDEVSLKANVEQFIKHMQVNYHSGTTKLLGIMTAEEAKAFINQEIAKEKKNWQSDSQEWIDNMNNLYKKCYEEIL